MGRRTLGLRKWFSDRQRTSESKGSIVSENDESEVEWPEPAPEPDKEPTHQGPEGEDENEES